MNRLTPNQLSQIEPLLAAYPHHPLRLAHRLPAEQVLADDIAGLTGPAEKGLAAVDGNETPQGLVAVEERGWESQFYPFRLGHLPLVVAVEGRDELRRVYGRLLTWAQTTAREKLALDHLFCRAPAEDVALVQALETAGFRHMATMLEFTWRRDSERPAPAVTWPLRPATKADWSAVDRLARQTMTEIPTRYTADPHLPLSGTADLYGAWAAESMAGRFADIVLVITTATGEVAGFICGRFEPRLSRLWGSPVGDMTIGGVAPEHRQHGAFISLVQGLINWFWEHDADAVVTRTQVSNYGSQRTLLRCQGRLVGSQHAFHWLAGAES